MNKSILIVDTWTLGQKHLIEPINYFQENGYDIFFMHANSINLRNQKVDFLKEVKYLDIFENGYIEIDDFVKSNKIDAAIFLSTNSFVLQAILRILYQYRIKTFHFYHGLNSLINIDNYFKRNYISFLNSLPRKAVKNLKIINFYYKSLRINKNVLSSGTYILKMLRDKLFYNKIHSIYEDTYTDFGVVYCKADALHMYNNYGVKLENILLIGFPDLNKFKLNNIIFSDFKKKQVIYISTATSDEDLIFNSHEQYGDFLLSIKRDLNELGYDMIFKFKPHGRLFNDKLFFKKLQDNGIKLSANEDFVDILLSSRFVLTEPSTLSVVPAFLNLKIGLVNYKPFSNNFGPFLSSYPGSLMVNNLEDLRRLDSLILDNDLLLSWRFDNITMLPENVSVGSILQSKIIGDR